MQSKQFTNYRQSHIDRGEDYDQTFFESGHRALIWEYEKIFLDRVVKLFPNSQGIRHLDFACGTGRIVAFLESKVENSIGVDISPTMLEVARKRVTNSHLICADITQSDVLKNTWFNLITAFRFFPNAEPDLRLAAMSHLVERLAPSGRIVFNNHLNKSSVIFYLLRLFNKPFASEGVENSEMFDLIQKSGLEIEKIFHVGISPAIDNVNILPMWIIRLIENVASQNLFLHKLSQNTVFVCRRRK